MLLSVYLNTYCYLNEQSAERSPAMLTAVAISIKRDMTHATTGVSAFHVDSLALSM